MSTVNRYGHVETSVNYHTIIPGKLRLPKTVPNSHIFVSNRQLPFLNQRKGKNDRGKDFFMINFHECMCRTENRPGTSGVVFVLIRRCFNAMSLFR